MLEKTAEDKKERFRRLDLVLEFDLFGENFRWPNESQEPRCPAVGLLPELDRGRAEARAELIRLESGEVAQGVHAPFVENRDDVRELSGAVDVAQGFVWQDFFGPLHSRKLGPERIMFNRT